MNWRMKAVEKEREILENTVKERTEEIAQSKEEIETQRDGLYKQKKCNEAYDYMKKVVDAIGLNDEEIILHWKKIKECSKK